MSFQVNYTWAHAIDDASDAFLPQQNQTVFPANSFYLGRERGNSSYDVRNRLVFNYVAELPLGRGKSHLSNGFMGRVLEGWTWSGIGTFQSGFPFEIFESGVDSDGTGATQRADYSLSPTVVPVNMPITQTGPMMAVSRFRCSVVRATFSATRSMALRIRTLIWSSRKTQSFRSV